VAAGPFDLAASPSFTFASAFIALFLLIEGKAVAKRRLSAWLPLSAHSRELSLELLVALAWHEGASQGGSRRR
jgi:hypothetical protein